MRGRLRGGTGKVFVILATDGAPNCNANASCAIDQCQANIENVPGCPTNAPESENCCASTDARVGCNDGPATVSEISALKASGIPVYVVGLPGTGAYASLLDAMASAGGTALPTSPKYFAVNGASEALMLTALRKIAAQITGTCTYDLKEAPAHADLVNVYLDDGILPFAPVNGWSIQDRTVTLNGTSCERVKNGDVLDVRIIAGCPRFEPK